MCPRTHVSEQPRGGNTPTRARVFIRHVRPGNSHPASYKPALPGNSSHLFEQLHQASSTKHQAPSTKHTNHAPHASSTWTTTPALQTGVIRTPSPPPHYPGQAPLQGQGLHATPPWPAPKTTLPSYRRAERRQRRRTVQGVLPARTTTTSSRLLDCTDAPHATQRRRTVLGAATESHTHTHSHTHPHTHPLTVRPRLGQVPFPSQLTQLFSLSIPAHGIDLTRVCVGCWAVVCVGCCVCVCVGCWACVCVCVGSRARVCGLLCASVGCCVRVWAWAVERVCPGTHMSVNSLTAGTRTHTRVTSDPR